MKIIFILLGLLMYFISWLVVCAVVKLITIILGTAFTWIMATMIFLLLLGFILLLIY